MPIFVKSGNFKLLEPQGLAQACTMVALPVNVSITSTTTVVLMGMDNLPVVLMGMDNLPAIEYKQYGVSNGEIFVIIFLNPAHVYFLCVSKLVLNVFKCILFSTSKPVDVGSQRQILSFLSKAQNT